jgi:hypothetical protein
VIGTRNGNVTGQGLIVTVLSKTRLTEGVPTRIDDDDASRLGVSVVLPTNGTPVVCNRRRSNFALAFEGFRKETPRHRVPEKEKKERNPGKMETCLFLCCLSLDTDLKERKLRRKHPFFLKKHPRCTAAKRRKARDASLEEPE